MLRSENNLPTEVLWTIYDFLDYMSLKNLAKASVIDQVQISEYLLHRSKIIINKLQHSAKDINLSDITLQHLMERVYHLNNYVDSNPSGITISRDAWVKGKNKITYKWTRDGILQGEVWYRDGKLHREDGPAWNDWENEKQINEGWYRDGKLHREDGPAINNWQDEKKIRECWYRDGKYHREDGPAFTTWQNEKKIREGWFRDGKSHREDGPAWTKWENEKKIMEKWYHDDNLHRVEFY